MSPDATMKPLVLEDFEGAWTFERTVQHANGDSARMTGLAMFTPDAEGLVHDETGQMSLNGAPPLTATRRYLWRPGLEVRFDDGRPFHTVPQMGGTASHWCDPDIYTVSYDFASWPDWTATWQVKGPRKDYRMVTRYLRRRCGPFSRQ